MVALADVRKAIEMFRQVNVEILGVVENMSYFSCPHCNGRIDIFGHGEGERMAKTFDVPFLGEIEIRSADPHRRRYRQAGRFARRRRSRRKESLRDRPPGRRARERRRALR